MTSSLRLCTRNIYISSQSSPKRFRCQDTSPHRWWCTECLNAMCASGTSVWPVDGIFGVRSKGLVAGQRGLWKTWLGDTIYRYWTHLDGIKIHHVDSLYIPICCTCACAYAISKKHVAACRFVELTSLKVADLGGKTRPKINIIIN